MRSGASSLLDFHTSFPSEDPREASPSLDREVGVGRAATVRSPSTGEAHSTRERASTRAANPGGEYVGEYLEGKAARDARCSGDEPELRGGYRPRDPSTARGARCTSDVTDAQTATSFGISFACHRNSMLAALQGAATVVPWRRS